MAATAPNPNIPKEAPPPYSAATGDSYANPNYVPSSAAAPMPNVAATSEAGDSEAPFAASGLSDQGIRRRFIRKVYLILTAQLLVTIICIAVFQFVKPVKLYVQSNIWLYISSIVIFLVLYIILVCAKKVRRSFPGNFVALALFTLAFSYMAGAIASFYDLPSVLFAAVLTAGITLSVTLFVLFVKTDFTFLVSLGLALVAGILLFCLAVGLGYGYFVPRYGSYYGLQSVYGGLIAIAFGIFLTIDTWLVLKSDLSEEEYIYGALQLYIDIVYIFLLILGLRGRS